MVAEDTAGREDTAVRLVLAIVLPILAIMLITVLSIVVYALINFATTTLE